jgi:hypothetical protein
MKIELGQLMEIEIEADRDRIGAHFHFSSRGVESDSLRNDVSAVAKKSLTRVGHDLDDPLVVTEISDRFADDKIELAF